MPEICKHSWRLEDKTILGERLSVIFICSQCGEIRPLLVESDENISEPSAMRGVSRMLYKIKHAPRAILLFVLIVLIILLAIFCVMVL